MIKEQEYPDVIEIIFDLEDRDEPVIGGNVQKVNFSVSGIKWQFHKADVDTHWGGVHGHNSEKGLVINQSGVIFNERQRQPMRQIGKGDLAALQAKISEWVSTGKVIPPSEVGK